MFAETLNDLLKQHGVVLTQDMQKKMLVYFECLIEANKKLNLTRITQPDIAARDHFYDSLSPLFFLDIPQNCPLRFPLPTHGQAAPARRAYFVRTVSYFRKIFYIFPPKAQTIEF